jgi:hypothetical protein
MRISVFFDHTVSLPGIFFVIRSIRRVAFAGLM